MPIFRVPDTQPTASSGQIVIGREVRHAQVMRRDQVSLSPCLSPCLSVPPAVISSPTSVPLVAPAPCLRLRQCRRANLTNESPPSTATIPPWRRGVPMTGPDRRARSHGATVDVDPRLLLHVPPRGSQTNESSLLARREEGPRGYSCFSSLQRSSSAIYPQYAPSAVPYFHPTCIPRSSSPGPVLSSLEGSCRSFFSCLVVPRRRTLPAYCSFSALRVVFPSLPSTVTCDFASLRIPWPGCPLRLALHSTSSHLSLPALGTPDTLAYASCRSPGSRSFSPVASLISSSYRNGSLQKPWIGEL